MIRLTLLLLMAGLVVGGHHAPYNNGNHAATKSRTYYPNGYVQPIDYDDDLTISNPMVQPDSNIIFSFAQNRHDQPPQVDVREEKLGRYMLRRKHSTTAATITTTTAMTTTPAPLPEYSEESEESVSLESAEEVPNFESVRYPLSSKPIGMPFMLPTGTTAKPIVRGFHDFSSPLELPDSKIINPAARYPPVNIWPVRTSPLPRKPPSPEWDEFKKLSDFLRLSTENPKESQPEENIIPIVVDEETSRTVSPPTSEIPASRKALHLVNDIPTSRTDSPLTTEISTSTTALSPMTEITAEPVKNRSHKKRRPHQPVQRNRGNHKFSWDDLKLDASATPSVPAALSSPPVAMAAPPAATPRLGPPPPVPTLSPWAGDNFGKR